MTGPHNYRVYKDQTGDIFFDRKDAEGNLLLTSKLVNRQLSSKEMKTLQDTLNQVSEMTYKSRQQAKNMSIDEGKKD